MISFSIFNIPVRVMPSFWLFMGLFGFMFSGQGQFGGPTTLILTALFILTAFVSVLLHELGHALTGRLFTKSPAAISIESMGGMAMFSYAKFTKWQHVMMVAAGPLVNFILAGIFIPLSLYAPELFKIPVGSLFHQGLQMAAWLNIIWGVFNLLPVYPLDGGQIMHSFIRNPIKAHQASFVAAIILIGVAIMLRAPIGAIFMGFMAFQNYQIMNSMRR